MLIAGGVYINVLAGVVMCTTSHC